VIRTAVICSSFAAGADSYRHSAYGFRFATVAYRWHPLFGRTLQVSPFRRGKALTCIYTLERPDLCRELPNWMFDEGYCVGMTLGAPEISIAGLNELAAVLALLGVHRGRDAHFRPSNEKERDGAEESVSKSRAAHSRAGAPGSSTAGGAQHAGTGRGPGGSSAGGAGDRRHDVGEQGGRR
jgi:hypothetical protein